MPSPKAKRSLNRTLDLTSSVCVASAEAKLKAFLERRELAKASLDDYLRIFRRVAIGAFGGLVLPLPEDAAAVLQQHLDQLHTEGYAPVTIRNHLALMRDYARALGCPGVFDPCVLPVPLKKKLTQTLLPAEVDRLFAHLAKHDPRARGIFELVLLTGLRLSELMSLQYTRPELEAGRVLVKAPNGLPRPVFIGTQASKLLAGYLGPRKGLPRTSKARLALTESLRKAGVALGLPEVTPSRLRMTYAVRNLVAGRDFEFVAKNMGLNQGSTEPRRRLKEVLVDHLARVKHAA